MYFLGGFLIGLGLNLIVRQRKKDKTREAWTQACS